MFFLKNEILKKVTLSIGSNSMFIKKLTGLVDRSVHVLKPLFFFPLIISIVFINYGFEWSLGSAPKNDDQANSQSSYYDIGASEEAASSERVYFDRSEDVDDEEEKLKELAENLAKQVNVSSAALKVSEQVSSAKGQKLPDTKNVLPAVSLPKASSASPVQVPRSSSLGGISGISSAISGYRSAKQIPQGVTSSRASAKEIGSIMTAQREAENISKAVSPQVYRSTEQAQSNKKLLSEIERARAHNSSRSHSSLNDIIRLEQLRLVQGSVKAGVNATNALAAVEEAKEDDGSGEKDIF